MSDIFTVSRLKFQNSSISNRMPRLLDLSVQQEHISWCVRPQRKNQREGSSQYWSVITLFTTVSLGITLSTVR